MSLLKGRSESPTSPRPTLHGRRVCLWDAYSRPLLRPIAFEA
jgi:hypothetical protein